ncbi:MAG: response regulator, partial [Bauldia sp.]|nr:response regulator [Bauldia sp.]
MHASLSAQRLVDVVILDGDPSQRRVLTNLIARSGERFHVHAFAERSEAIAAAARMPGAILLVDIDTVGDLARLADLSRTSPNVIATSAAGSVHLAVAAVKAGAADFLPKPIGA